MTVPGLEEMLEDAIHLVADGHTAHEAGHADEQPGHCCSGLFHFCACHAHAVAVLAAASSVLAARATLLSTRGYEHEGFRAGFSAPPFRPPTLST